MGLLCLSFCINFILLSRTERSSIKKTHTHGHTHTRRKRIVCLFLNMAEKYPFLPLSQQPKVTKIRNKTNNHQTQLYKIIFLAIHFERNGSSLDWLTQHTKGSIRIALWNLRCKKLKLYLQFHFSFSTFNFRD